MNCKVVYIWTTLVYFIIRILCMQHVNHKKAAIIFEALSKIIIKRREELNKSQRILADEFGFPRSLLSRLENCMSEPKLISIWTIAEALELKPHQLIKLIEEELGEGFSLIEK